MAYQYVREPLRDEEADQLCQAWAAVQRILGHDRLATTAIYLNLTDAHVVEEYSLKW